VESAGVEPSAPEAPDASSALMSAEVSCDLGVGMCSSKSAEYSYSHSESGSTSIVAAVAVTDWLCSAELASADQ